MHTKSQSNANMFLMSEKGGAADDGLEFRFDSRRSNASGGGKKLGGTGDAHSEDNNLLELMVMQNAVEAIRQEYIEEPSYRKSMFNAEAEDISVKTYVEIT